MTADQTDARPIPEPDEATAPFFEAARRGVLLIQRCAACDVFLAPGTRACTECLAESLDWVEASGRGTLFTFGVMHQRYHPGFFDRLPYNVAEVELDEGPRVNTTIAGVANEELRVGMRVVVTFDALTDDVAVPRFRPA